MSSINELRWVRQRSDVVVVAAAQLHSIKPKLRFCATSDHTHSESEICHVKNL